MLEPLTQHQGIAAVLLRDNVDTDQIIPSREMKTVSRNGLAEGLFAGWRYTAPGSRELVPDFVLNRAENTGATILRKFRLRIVARACGLGTQRIRHPRTDCQKLW